MKNFECYLHVHLIFMIYCEWCLSYLFSWYIELTGLFSFSFYAKDAAWKSLVGMHISETSKKRKTFFNVSFRVYYNDIWTVVLFFIEQKKWFVYHLVLVLYAIIWLLWGHQSCHFTQLLKQIGSGITMYLKWE